MNTLEYLQAVKNKLGIESDYALAKRLGVSRSAVSSLQLGKSVFSDDVALSVSQILGIPPIMVIAQANAERATTPENRARWMGVMEKISESFKDLLSGCSPRQPSLLAR